MVDTYRNLSLNANVTTVMLTSSAGSSPAHMTKKTKNFKRKEVIMYATNQKPTTGRLIYNYPSGRSEVLEANKPFALLQQLKKEYTLKGYTKENLKITY